MAGALGICGVTPERVQPPAPNRGNLPCVSPKQVLGEEAPGPPEFQPSRSEHGHVDGRYRHQKKVAPDCGKHPYSVDMIIFMFAIDNVQQ